MEPKNHTSNVLVKIQKLSEYSGFNTEITSELMLLMRYIWRYNFNTHYTFYDKSNFICCAIGVSEGEAVRMLHNRVFDN